MKVSLWIEKGISQVVLTSENEFETQILDTIKNGEKNVKFLKGSFCECQGGYVRYYDDDNESLIITLKERKEKKENLNESTRTDKK